MQRRRSLFQPRIRLHLHLVPIQRWQLDHDLRESEVLNQLVRRLTQVQDISGQEDSHYSLEILCQLLFKRGQSHVPSDLH